MSGTGASDKEQPLAGAVICFTAVTLEYRTQLLNIAKEMGATERPDLTSEVTHLLVGATESAKYRFVARERNDVAVVRPEWIEAVRKSWVLDEDTDIRALEIEYKLPTFFGLTLCITGFSDMGLRTKMHDTSVENGAEFRRDLTKSVTHLVSRTAEGEKYKFATQWGIKVVSEKWFYDSIERGMILDEEKYHPLVPSEEQGVGAWNRSSLTSPSVFRKQRSAPNGGSADTRPRKKLRRTASTKLAGQNENIWGDIIGAGFLNNDTTDSVNDEDEDDNSPPPKPVLQAAKSFASESVFSQAVAPEAAKVPEGFLGGSYFYLHGFSPKQMGVLHRHLGFNGAQCVASLTEFSRPSIPKTGQGLYIMVPYQTLKSEIPSTDDMAFECEVVTDMWLEKCLHARALVSPESHVASTPFPRFPIPEFSGLRVCSTGFGGIDLLHVSKLVNLMGASYGEVLTPQATILVCFDPQTASQNKLRHTREWRVPAVSAEWLWSSIRTGQKEEFEPYLVQKQTSHPQGSVEKLGAAFENEDNAHQQVNTTRDGQSKAPEGVTNGQISQVSKSAKINRTRMMPIIDDGFSNEHHDDAPKPSIPESRSPSPSRTDDRPTTSGSTTKQPDPNHSEAAPSALDTALKGLLQQAQAAKSRKSKEDPATTEEGSFPLRRKRKPLLGRAPSHSSSKVDNQAAPSRASSVDTLNDDGLGPSLESVGPTRANSISRPPSRVNNDESLSSMFSGAGRKFDFLADKQASLNENGEDEENTEPQMTQLDYEDADAAAMRAEFLRDAGKVARKPNQADPGMLLGEVKELEDFGWGSGRRTRKHLRDDD
ncbi:hypothetical protein N7490_000833 [Penicillium lividum]|nr:hypothetical protein N7490_000833 [Penicillium lividum]